MMEIKETEYGYEVSELVNGGYLQRCQCAYYNIISKWNKDLQFLDMTVDRDTWEELQNPNEFHHNRALRAKARHLKDLKLYLGLIEKEEAKEENIIWSGPHYSFDDNIHVDKFIETDKLFTRGSEKYNKSYMNYTKADEDKLKLVDEFQKKYEEFKKYKKEVFEKLFGE